jgi:radical SAM superfamily enzyme YgiQ (UPF0313 family)
MHREFNPLAKKWKKGYKGVALVYPNRYIGGISNVGLQYIYSKVNSLSGFICERFYTDVFEGLKSVESGNLLQNFDFAFFSLQYEEDAFKVYEILEKTRFSGVKVAGGPCIMENPLPYSKLFDVMFIGEVERSNFIERVFEGKVEGLEGAYVPKNYKGDLKVKRVRRVRGNLEDHIRDEIIGEGAYGKSLLLEIGRGCKRNCRFCIVKQIYSPVRWRDKEVLLEVAENYRKIIDRVALIAPSPSDHPKFKEIIFSLNEMDYTVSPSSLRADKLDDEILELLVESGLKSLTIAPEAGSEKLRKVINKGISEENVLNAARMAGEKGIEKIKLYFMVGLPGETQDDLRDILELSRKVREFVRKVEISVNPLVPKPHTPFQFLSFGGELEFRREDIKELKRKIKFLREEFKKAKGFEFKAASVEEFAVQTVISRGNEDVFDLIKAGRKNAFRNIFRFGLEKYLDAMETDDMPWLFIDHGYNPKRLEKEFRKAMALIEG